MRTVFCDPAAMRAGATAKFALLAFCAALGLAGCGGGGGGGTTATAAAVGTSSSSSGGTTSSGSSSGTTSSGGSSSGSTSSGSSSGSTSSSGSSSGTTGGGSSSSGSSSGGSSSGTSTPGSGNATFWIPFLATSTGTGGQDGIAVVPASSVTTAPVIIQPQTPALPEVLGVAYNGTANAGGYATAISFAYFMYAAADSGNNVHIYALDLTTSAQPVATQVGSLSIALPANGTVDQVICPDTDSTEANLTDPTSLFLVVHLPGPNGCGTGGDTYEVVNYTDAASTAPQAVTLPASATTGFVKLYNASGALASMAVFDATNHVVDAYSFASYTSGSPTPLAGTPVAAIANVNSMTPFTSTSRYVGEPEVMDVTLTASPTIHSLYSLLAANPTTAKLAFTEPTAGTLSGGQDDATNLYFIDSTSAGSTTTQTVYQLPLAGGTATPLLANNAYTSTTGQALQIIGSNGSVVMVAGNATSGGLVTSSFYGLPVGQLTASLPAGPLQVSGLPADWKMVFATPGDPTSSVVLINWWTQSGATFVPYSAILSIATSPKVLQNALAGSDFMFGTTLVGGSVLQITGITDTTHAYGGGTMNTLALASLVRTPLTNAGAAYTIPTGTVAFMAGMASNQAGAGFLTNGTSLAYSLATDYIVPVTLANTTITYY